jgi:hypothetical protein
MKIRGGKGQIQLSFGMIFSIIIIIATVAVGFYVVTYFLNLSSCTKVGLFWDSLNKEIDKAWNADMTETVFKGDLPSGIKKVCFGNFTQAYAASDSIQFNELRTYEIPGRNAYLYPTGKACDIAFYALKHARTGEFFCVPVSSGKASIKLSKTSFDALVKLSRP